jgi:hypothetical protein
MNEVCALHTDPAHLQANQSLLQRACCSSIDSMLCSGQLQTDCSQKNQWWGRRVRNIMSIHRGLIDHRLANPALRAAQHARLTPV